MKTLKIRLLTLCFLSAVPCVASANDLIVCPDLTGAKLSVGEWEGTIVKQTSVNVAINVDSLDNPGVLSCNYPTMGSKKGIQLEKNIKGKYKKCSRVPGAHNNNMISCN